MACLVVFPLIASRLGPFILNAVIASAVVIGQFFNRLSLMILMKYACDGLPIMVYSLQARSACFNCLIVYNDLFCATVVANE